MLFIKINKKIKYITSPPSLNLKCTLEAASRSYASLGLIAFNNLAGLPLFFLMRTIIS